MKGIVLAVALIAIVVAAIALTGDSPMKLYDSLVWLGIHVPLARPVAWAIADWVHGNFLPDAFLVP